MSLWLARHGETEENAEGRILGRRDPPLSPAGITQAEELAARLRDANPRRALADSGASVPAEPALAHGAVLELPL